MDELLLRMAALCVGGRKAAPGGARAGQAEEAGTSCCSGDGSRAVRLPRASGASRGAPTSNAIATIANRLPRGRTYVRNGSVVDLQIAKGEVAAMVAGSDLYKIKIAIAPVKNGALESHLSRLRGSDRFAGRATAGPFGQGRHGPGLPGGRRPVSVAGRDQAVTAAVRTGPTCASTLRRYFMALAPGSTKSLSFFSCCAAWMKTNCIDSAGQDLPLSKATPGAAKVLDDSDVAALFGIEIAETASADIPSARKQPRRFKTVKGSKSAETKTPAKKDKSPRASRSKPEHKWVSPVRARKRRATAGSQD